MRDFAYISDVIDLRFSSTKFYKFFQVIKNIPGVFHAKAFVFGVEQLSQAIRFDYFRGNNNLKGC